MIVMSNIVTLEPGDIANLAYGLWEERRRPVGSPEIDWFHAEAILTYRAVHPLPSALACGCDDVKTEKALTAGWTFFVLPEPAVAEFSAKAARLLPSGRTEFHAKEMNRQTESRAYEKFLELIKDTIAAHPYAFVRTIGANMSWRQEFGGFAERVAKSAVQAAGGHGADTDRLLTELAPPVWTLQRLIRRVGKQVRLDLDLDQDTILEKLALSKTAFGTVEISTSRLLAVICNTYSARQFPMAPRFSPDGSTIAVKTGDKSFLIQAADVVGNFALANCAVNLGLPTPGRLAKSEIFERVFGPTPARDLAQLARLAGNEIEALLDGELQFSYADEFYEL
jgi:hypothetical protein